MTVSVVGGELDEGSIVNVLNLLPFTVAYLPGRLGFPRHSLTLIVKGRVKIVRHGDSLWKIYRSLGDDRAGPKSWAEFLSRMSRENGIGDPDLIQPGRVLSVKPAQPGK